jgi:hypothetical protein
MPLIKEIFAFVAEDAPGEEGIMAIRSDEMWIPLIGADIRRVEALRPIADTIAKQTGKPYRILFFKLEKEVEVAGPDRAIEGLKLNIN